MKNRIITTCPLTGLKITTSPDWEIPECSKGYGVSFKLIGTNIIHGEGVGKGSIEGFSISLGLASKIIKENFNNRPFVYIENFEYIINPSAGARKFYTNFMKNLKNMEALIYYNVGAYLKFNIKLAKKLNILHYPVFIVENYEKAVALATNILKFGKDSIHYRSKNTIVLENPEWNLEYSDFKISYEIINGDIFHVKPEGIFKQEYLDPVSKLRNRIIKENFSEKNRAYYYLIDYGNLQVPKLSRKSVLKSINEIYNNYPFKYYIMYNLGRAINVIVSLSLAFIKYPVKREKDFNSAIAFIESDKKGEKHGKFSFLKKKRKKREKKIDEYLEEFIQFLGKIDWEKIGIDENSFIKDKSHPFYQVYEAISVIKDEIDKLYLEKEKNKEERAILEYKLQQSLKLEAIGKLAGTVAHDLNNVLMGVVSYPDFVIRLLKNNNTEKAIEYIKKIKESGIRAANIVQDLLTLSGRGIKSITVLNLNSIIEEYLNSPEFANLQNRNQNIEIKFSPDNSLYNMQGSKIHLYKTIMNLIKNGIEAIKDEGEIIISTKNIKFENKKIEGYDKPLNGDYLEIIVADTGIGISKQDLLKIFEPFYSKKTAGKKGTGLGMLVVKQTVEDHHGVIEVKSEEGRGTEFRLYFPAEKNLASEKIIREIDNYTGKGELILVVDDEEEQRLIAKDILKDLHYNVKTVSSGEEAIEYVKHNNVDLILLDMIMNPGIGGLETYKRIIKINPNQKTIIVSGYSEKGHVLEAQKLGVNKFIRKPYTIETIGKAIYEELNIE